MGQPKPGEYSRHCYNCNLTLPIDDFKVTNKQGRSYYSSKCSTCVKSLQRQTRKKRR